VLVSLKYDGRALTAIRALPPSTRHWDATSKVWRVHPGYAEQLAATPNNSRLPYGASGTDAPYPV
jgi:hypothetical protein